MTQKAQEAQEGGNTKTPSRSRKYCLTLNNYSDEEYDALKKFFSAQDYYIIGKEVGEQGTPHLQCYVENHNKISFNTLKKICPRAHIETAKGSQKENFQYCSKDGIFESNIKCKLKAPSLAWKDYELSEWELKVIFSLKSEPDPRKITWFFDTVGGKGKTRFCKYIMQNYEAMYFTGGKNTDITSQILLLQEKEEIPSIFLFDLPRTSEGKISYNSLEQIKNGLINSSKYKGGTAIFNTPHIFVFANYEPNYENLSLDRWEIIELE